MARRQQGNFNVGQSETCKFFKLTYYKINLQLNYLRWELKSIINSTTLLNY